MTNRAVTLHRVIGNLIWEHDASGRRYRDNNSILQTGTICEGILLRRFRMLEIAKDFIGYIVITVMMNFRKNL